jgi:hypothetical protein
MTERNDNLNRELRWLDPVEPGEFGAAAESPTARAMLERIVATAPEMAPTPTPVRRRSRRSSCRWRSRPRSRTVTC